MPSHDAPLPPRTAPPRAVADTPVLPHAPWKGKLDWKLLLGWLRDDRLISAEDGERVTQRFGAGASSLHALVRLGGAGLVRAGTRRPLDTEALTEWLAERIAACRYLRIDPLKADVGRVADVMSVHYAESRCALPVQVAATEVVIATAEPFDTGWVAEIEAHTRAQRASWCWPTRRTCASTRPSSMRWPSRCARRRRAARSRRRPASSSWSSWARPTSSSMPTTRAWCRWSTGCGSTPSTSAPATSTSSRGATWARSASASTACCTPSTRCRWA